MGPSIICDDIMTFILNPILKQNVFNVVYTEEFPVDIRKCTNIRILRIFYFPVTKFLVSNRIQLERLRFVLRLPNSCMILFIDCDFFLSVGCGRFIFPQNRF